MFMSRMAREPRDMRIFGRAVGSAHGDNIGSRETAIAHVTTNTYGPNQLNQYLSVTSVTATATNTASLSYDADGNLTNDGQRAYFWNGENRLAATQPLTVGAGTNRVQFSYDYMGRRVRKVVLEWDGSAWGNGETNLFLYDGWNLIEEFSDSATNWYVWGLDLSGTLQGAGGIGGLLAGVAVDSGGTNSLLYACGANGNITEVVGDDGSLKAHYRYSPFGGVVESSGDEAEDNPFRFSSKYWDDDVGLGYWGYRWYSPELGRWLNRDPIGEEGGLNLYLFVGNDPTDSRDLLGLLEYALLTVGDSLTYGTPGYQGYLPLLKKKLSKVKKHSINTYEEIGAGGMKITDVYSVDESKLKSDRKLRADNDCLKGAETRTFRNLLPFRHLARAIFEGRERALRGRQPEPRLPRPRLRSRRPRHRGLPITSMFQSAGRSAA